MLDASPPLPAMQRATGVAAVSIGAGGLRRLRQEGSAKAFLPRVHGGVPEVVFLNTAGGLAGGDRLTLALSVRPGAQLVATTQAAERAYRASGEPARMEVSLRVSEGAGLAWLPQETILFQGARLTRRTQARIGGTSRLVLCEMVMLGRMAMGEAVTRLAFSDYREVRRDNRPALIEPLRLNDEALARSGGAAILAGARAFATVALIAPGAEDALGPLSAALPDGAAASGWDGKCVGRLVAPDVPSLRRGVAAALSVLHRGPLPRVWRLGGDEEM